MNDDELYRLFLSGDTASYDQLMIRYGDSLTYYLNGYLHNLHDAEDLMIEAFARIMVKAPVIRAGNFKAYLFKTARHLAARFHERNRHFQIVDLEAISEQKADDMLPEDLFASEERKQVLHICLNRIGPDFREALWLIYFEDMNYADAASVMGVSTKKIDNLLARGKKKLKEELRKEGFTNAYE